MEQYDLLTDTWQLMESVGVKVHYNDLCCDVVALDGHLYFIGMEQIHAPVEPTGFRNVVSFM